MIEKVLLLLVYMFTLIIKILLLLLKGQSRKLCHNGSTSLKSQQFFDLLVLTIAYKSMDINNEITVDIPNETKEVTKIDDDNYDFDDV